MLPYTDTDAFAPAAGLRYGAALDLRPHRVWDDARHEASLLDAAMRLHRAAIARHCGALPEAMTDASGERVLPLIVSSRVAGDLGSLDGGTLPALTLASAPTPQTGWRSRIVASAGIGTVRIDLVSRFARRIGASNASLRSARMQRTFRTAPPEDLPEDVRGMRARRAALGTAGEAAMPLISSPIASNDLDHTGILPMRTALRAIAAAEDAALGETALLPVRSREIHWYANADAGERLDVGCDLLVSDFAPSIGVMTAFALRRHSDDALVAACEIVRDAV